MDQEDVPAGPLHGDALFQVEGQQRVNPDLSPEDRAAISALHVGKSITLSFEESTVRVRRTR